MLHCLSFNAAVHTTLLNNKDTSAIIVRNPIATSEHIFCFEYVLNVQQNSINLSRIRPDRCKIIEYSGLSHSTYTGLSSYR
jgi:hypothetical protein